MNILAEYLHGMALNVLIKASASSWGALREYLLGESTARKRLVKVKLAGAQETVDRRNTHL